MNRLVSVIGPAPSEDSPSGFIERLKEERRRIVEEIRDWREGKGMVKKKKAPPPPLKVSEVFLAQMRKKVEEEVRKKLKERK